MSKVVGLVGMVALALACALVGSCYKGDPPCNPSTVDWPRCDPTQPSWGAKADGGVRE